jgi:hypothetical protein
MSETARIKVGDRKLTKMTLAQNLWESRPAVLVYATRFRDSSQVSGAYTLWLDS